MEKMKHVFMPMNSVADEATYEPDQESSWSDSFVITIPQEEMDSIITQAGLDDYESYIMQKMYVDGLTIEQLCAENRFLKPEVVKSVHDDAVSKIHSIENEVEQDDKAGKEEQYENIEMAGWELDFYNNLDILVEEFKIGGNEMVVNDFFANEMTSQERHLLYCKYMLGLGREETAQEMGLSDDTGLLLMKREVEYKLDDFAMKVEQLMEMNPDFYQPVYIQERMPQEQIFRSVYLFKDVSGEQLYNYAMFAQQQGQLEPSMIDVIYLHAFKDLDMTSIADVMNMSVKFAKMYWTRAIDSLKEAARAVDGYELEQVEYAMKDPQMQAQISQSALGKSA